MDLSLDRTQLGFEGELDPKNPEISGRKRKTLLQKLQNEAEKEVSGPLLEEIQKVFAEYLEQEFSLTTDPYDAQTLLFEYPSETDSLESYVKPVVRFEFGARGVLLPAELRMISPYMHQLVPDQLGDGDVEVKVLGIERTF